MHKRLIQAKVSIEYGGDGITLLMIVGLTCFVLRQCVQISMIHGVTSQVSLLHIIVR